MSVQFGRWHFAGQPPAPDYIEKVSAALAPYGPDSDESYSNGGIRILYRAFHTTKESRREKQPHVSPSGAVITWDGRLDNRSEIISELRDSLTVASTDVAIVAAAYEKWGAICFAKLIGDWALSIWHPRERLVVLAKDPIGTKHLYYSVEKDHVTWSTILDPLVLFAGRTFEICEEYVAGWFLSNFPASNLTPYVGIHAVPSSSSVLVRPGNHTVSKYWEFDPSKRIRHRTDGEYEAQFRSALATAVQRRLRSDRPILAELSGGMDSSTIVCMADTIIASGAAETPRLDTVSWYDDSDPGLDERPYFTKVEEKRGRTGCHIDIGAIRQKEIGTQKSFTSGFEGDRFAATPSPHRELSEQFKQYLEYMMSRGHRVTLSGIGGDEATGGWVPTPTPELQNLLVTAQFFRLAHQLKAWAAKMRKPQHLLLWEAVRGFFPRLGVPTTGPWLSPGFVRRNHAALCSYPSRVKLLGPLPSFHDNINKLNANRRCLARCGFRLELPRDTRYPYLDRDLLEFLYAIPPEQIVGVGKRRFLMKRALVGIVPDELLNRRRKAFVPREPNKDNLTVCSSLVEMGSRMVSSAIGIIDPDRFWEALQRTRHNQEAPSDALMRTMTLEFWLRHLAIQGVLTNSMSTEPRLHPISSGREARSARSTRKFS
jgi:asparagine synthase (glutamine-hydrolysing)